MKIKYFKNNLNNQDIYMKSDNEMKIISMSKEYFLCFANDEGGPIFGFYQNINMTPKEYNELLEIAYDQNRDKGITLLKKIHEKNLNLNKTKIFFQEKIPTYSKIEGYDLLKNFENSNPILK